MTHEILIKTTENWETGRVTFRWQCTCTATGSDSCDNVQPSKMMTKHRVEMAAMEHRRKEVKA